VLLMPTASIAKHDDHRTAAKPVRWLNVVASSGRRRTDDTRPAHGRACLRFAIHPANHPITKP
jgi:hypothetical protein